MTRSSTEESNMPQMDDVSEAKGEFRLQLSDTEARIFSALPLKDHLFAFECQQEFIRKRKLTTFPALEAAIDTTTETDQKRFYLLRALRPFREQAFNLWPSVVTLSGQILDIFSRALSFLGLSYIIRFFLDLTAMLKRGESLKDIFENGRLNRMMNDLAWFSINLFACIITSGFSIAAFPVAAKIANLIGFSFDVLNEALRSTDISVRSTLLEKIKMKTKSFNATDEKHLFEKEKALKDYLKENKKNETIWVRTLPLEKAKELEKKYYKCYAEYLELQIQTAHHHIIQQLEADLNKVIITRVYLVLMTLGLLASMVMVFFPPATIYAITGAISALVFGSLLNGYGRRLHISPPEIRAKEFVLAGTMTVGLCLIFFPPTALFGLAIAGASLGVSLCHQGARFFGQAFAKPTTEERVEIFNPENDLSIFDLQEEKNELNALELNNPSDTESETESCDSPSTDLVSGISSSFDSPLSSPEPDSIPRARSAPPEVSDIQNRPQRTNLRRVATSTSAIFNLLPTSDVNQLRFEWPLPNATLTRELSQSKHLPIFFKNPTIFKHHQNKVELLEDSITYAHAALSA